MLKWFNKNKEKKNKGFTLVELIVVIAILAILVGLLAPQYTKYVEKSRKSADASNLENIVTGFKVAASDQEYDLGGSAAETTYQIVITSDKTIITPSSDHRTEDYITALNAYAGLKLNGNAGTTSEGGTTGSVSTEAESDTLSLKSGKWGAAVIGSTTLDNSAIAAKVTITNTTDAVKVEYSENVAKYSKEGKTTD